MRVRELGMVAATAAFGLGITACGSSGEDSTAATASGSTSTSSTAAAPADAGVTKTWKGTGTLDGGGKSLVVFMPGGGLQFNGVWQQGAKQVAAENNYKIRFVSNAYDQSVQDSQVQQFLATGEKPAGFILYPAVPSAAKNSARQLGRVAPVVQATQGPPNTPASYAGNSHEQTGALEAGSYIKLLAMLKADGVKLRSPDGAVLFMNGPEGLEAGGQRRDGFIRTLESKGIKIKKVGEEFGEVDRQTGYKLANASLSKYTDKFDIVWALNLTGAAGIAQSLKEHGRKPGKDVWIVSGGDCTGGVGEITSGNVYSTVAQSPSIEGAVAIRSLIQLISAGGFKTGVTDTIKVTPDLPPLANEAPAENVLTPMAAIDGPDGAAGVKIWGQSVAETCPT